MRLLLRPDRRHRDTDLRRRFKIISVRRRRRRWRPDRRRRLVVTVFAVPRLGARIGLAIGPGHPPRCLRVRHPAKIPGSRILAHVKLGGDPPQRVALAAHRRGQAAAHIRRGQHVIGERRIPRRRGVVAEDPPITALQPISDQGDAFPGVAPDQPGPVVRRGLGPIRLGLGHLILAYEAGQGRREGARVTRCGHGPK